MKKLLTLSLVVSMLLSCVACGSSKKSADLGNTGTVTESSLKNNESTKSEKKEISRGEINGNVYYSEYSDLTFTKPDSWVYLSDEEIAAMMNVGAELLDYNEFTKTAAEMLSVFDMGVKDLATNTNINISYENLTMSGSTAITEDGYLDAVESQLAAVEAMDITVNGRSTVRLAGKEYGKMDCTTKYGNVEMKQVYYVRKIGSYMLAMVVTIPDGYTVSEIEDMIS